MGKLSAFVKLNITHGSTKDLREIFKFVYDRRTTTMATRVTTREIYRNKLEEFLSGYPNDEKVVELYNHWARKYNREHGLDLDTGIYTKATSISI